VNAPLLSDVKRLDDGDATGARIEGTLESTPDTSFRLEFFATRAPVGAKTHERREGETLLKAIDATTDRSGKVDFVMVLPSGVESRAVVSATATDASGNTSEFSAPLQAPAIIKSWNNVLGGNWNTPASWTPSGVPAATDDVQITLDGTYTVTMNSVQSAASLTLGGATGNQTLAVTANTLTLSAASVVNANGILSQAGGTIAGTGSLTINGTFNWSAGVMTGAGTTTVNGPFNLSGLVSINGSRILNNASTANWTAGVNQGMWTGTGSVINNTGTWDAKVDGGAIVNQYGGATTFNNFGSFKKSAGAGSTLINIPFVNTGTVNAQSGTISLGGGGSNSNTLTTTGAGATLAFAAGVFDLNAGTNVSGPGTILLNSSGTVNVNSAMVIPGTTTFTFTAGTLAGTGTLTLNGTFNWSAGVMTGAGTTTVNGPFNLSGLVGIQSGRILNNASTANWTAGAGQGMWTGLGSVINNTGTWDAKVDGGAIVNQYGGATTFNNSGTFKKSAGAGSTLMNIPFVNSGNVDVQSGTISLGGGGSSTNALIVSAVSSTLTFAAGVFNLDAGTTISGPGTVLLNTSGTVNVNSALAFPAATTFTFTAGTLGGTGALTTNGTFNWSAGLMTGAATTTVNGTFNLSGLPGINGSRTLATTSAVNWTAGPGEGFWTGGGSIINNTGTWDASVDGGAIVNHYGGATTFNNSGSFKKSAGAGSTLINISFVNTGTVNAQAGTISLGGGGSSTNTLTTTGASATLEFAAGVFNLDAGTNVSGPGTILLNSSGTLNVNSALVIPGTTTFTFANGTLAGTGALTVNGTFNWSAGLMTGAASTTLNGPFNLSGLPGINNSRVLNTTNVTTWTAGSGQGLWTGTGSIINNSGTWNATVDGGAIVNRYGGATNFNNSGTFKKSAGAGSTSVSTAFTNTGTVDAQSGTLNMSSSTYTQTAGTTKLTGGAFSSTTNINIQGGTLAGSGTVTGPVIVSGTGVLSPGLSAGALNLAGTYAQTSPGSFNVELGGLLGTQYDHADTTGAATLAGSLNVSLINAFSPAPGDSFTVMTYPSHTGTFTLNTPGVACVGWTATYGATTLALTAAPVPRELTGLTLLANKTDLVWDAAPAYTGTVYDVLRGGLNTLPVGPGAGETCLAQGISTPSTTDVATPAAGQGFWYVVRERVPACGTGTYGFAKSGTERVSTGCP
jgi:hypothetical protein